MFQTKENILKQENIKNDTPCYSLALNLSGMNLNDEEFELLLSTLGHYPLLKSLDLSRSKITDEQALKLVARLSEKCPALTSLDLSFNLMTDQSAIAIAKSLNIENLALLGNRFTDNCIEAFKQKRSLLYLDINHVSLLKKNELKVRLRVNRQRKALSMLRDLILLGHVARQRPDFFNIQTQLPLSIILLYLISDFEKVIPNSSTDIAKEGRKFAEFFFNRAYSKSLSRKNFELAEQYFSNKITLEKVITENKACYIM